MPVFYPDREQKESLTLCGRTISYRSYRNLVYVDRPVLPAFQSMHLFVPEAYYQGGSINGYTRDTAPVFMPNSVGGYMPGPLEEPGLRRYPPEGPNTIFAALEHGYVVAAPSIRGSSSRTADGTSCGKAPALIVDYKAAIRYLHFFADLLPGDENKIITNGTSAGGALSAMAGSTGNHPDYLPYLKELGAADASDAVFAASCYCPIINLDHADMAYEWQFDGVYDYHRMHMNMDEGGRPSFTPVDGMMGEEDQQVSRELAAAFPAYVNSLQLTDETGSPLTLAENGEGSFKEYIKGLVLASAAHAAAEGVPVLEKNWLKRRADGSLEMDFSAYVRDITRMKTAPAFDPLDCTSGENLVFGTPEEDYLHFTAYGCQHRRAGSAVPADPMRVKMINPMAYVEDAAASKSTYWRIRHGEIDRDTSLSISAMFALKLREQGYDVDYRLPWNTPHSGDYDLKELFSWIDSICQR